MTRTQLNFWLRSCLAAGRRHPFLWCLAAVPLVGTAVAAVGVTASILPGWLIAAGVQPRILVAFAVAALIVMGRL